MKYYVLIVALTVFLFLWTTLAHCTTQPRPNSLGVYQTYENPYTYMVGAPVRVSLLEDGKGHEYTNVEFKALGDSMINTVPILFCGNEFAAFGDAHLRAVTYHTSVSRSYKGVGCHQILPTQSGVIVIE